MQASLGLHTRSQPDWCLLVNGNGVALDERRGHQAPHYYCVFFLHLALSASVGRRHVCLELTVVII